MKQLTVGKIKDSVRKELNKLKELMAKELDSIVKVIVFAVCIGLPIAIVLLYRLFPSNTTIMTIVDAVRTTKAGIVVLTATAILMIPFGGFLTMTSMDMHIRENGVKTVRNAMVVLIMCVIVKYGLNI